MSYIYAILVVTVLVLIFVFSYHLNSKVKIECDNKDMCEGCSVIDCYHRTNKED